MSVSLDNSTPPHVSVQPARKRLRLRVVAALVGEPLWVVFCMFGLSFMVVTVALKLFPFWVPASETTVGQLILNITIYALAVGFVLLPLLIRKVSWEKLRHLVGLDKGLKASGVVWAFSAFAIYFWTTVIVSLLATHIPGFDSEQQQDVGFDTITTLAEYIMAFIGLVVLPPIFEELLFRGYLFGRLRRYAGFWASTIVTSIAFGFVHGQWNVGVDTFVLSLFLCFLRERTGSLWAPILLHAIKNGIAYFFIFLAPLMGFNLI